MVWLLMAISPFDIRRTDSMDSNSCSTVFTMLARESTSVFCVRETLLPSGERT